jgi:tRNA1Val (adenine37-N6)-methyltransferase
MIKNISSKTKDFKFKQFHINGGSSGMPVSTDGVLLGAWAELADAHSILDIGTGTGLLTLMCAQRFSHTAITAIDINQEAIDAAGENFSASPWPERITLLRGDILDYQPKQRFDAIICNPPYFNSGEQSAISQRAQARHSDSLDHAMLLKRAHSLLSDNGKACFILPKAEGDAFIALAQQQQLFLSACCCVKSTERKTVSRYLLEFRPQPAETRRSTLTIHDNNGYSDAFITLTRDFYLKM